MPEHTPSIVVAGGGTAGHIEPALAVADALRDRHGAKVTALGTRRGLELELVPERGYDLRLIDPVPVPRKPNLDLVKLPANLLRAVRQTRTILQDVGADALIGFGGYVSAPAYVAARSLKLPFYVHEANAKAGIANKLGVRLGGIGFNAVSGSGLPGAVVGIPIRSGISGDREGEAAQRGREAWGLSPDRSTILVTGGSQGARSLNEATAGAVAELSKAGFQILHAYGSKNDAPAVAGEIDGYVAVPFISDMAAAYGVADLVVCRAGAMTVAEITAAGIPAIYVPLPHGNGEQALNATAVVEAGAARLVADGDFDADAMVREVRAVLDDAGTFNEMAAAATNSEAGQVADLLADRIVADLGH
ncbi:undecaprenyldiphospho-muramoylpentapeptide beta-N-acetylglucosaminyltransferase [Corynebacterium halotolerans]|uniref:undecaprenyldiphospho-muramoylpentapeptide beta-N-acetylglucosaminyltransferase n=1 Tax=Corynebacterium halotolerans TaxID=225326 RepID=UPI003CE79B92